MHHPANFNDMTDGRNPNHGGVAIESSSLRKTVLLIESRPLMGEIFLHALKKAADDLDIRIMASSEDAGHHAALAVLSFLQRSSDPLFIGFVVQQWKVRLAGLPLLVITDDAAPAVGKVIAENGVRHWVTAPMGFGAFVAEIRQALSQTLQTELHVFNGQAILEPAAIHQPQPAPERSLRSGIHLTLTDREIDVLALLQKGKQNKVIAHALNISESTAKVHIRNIMRKFHLHNRTEVALMCGAPVPRSGAPMLFGPDFQDGQIAVPAVAF